MTTTRDYRPHREVTDHFGLCLQTGAQGHKGMSFTLDLPDHWPFGTKGNGVYTHWQGHFLIDIHEDCTNVLAGLVFFQEPPPDSTENRPVRKFGRGQTFDDSSRSQI